MPGYLKHLRANRTRLRRWVGHAITLVLILTAIAPASTGANSTPLIELEARLVAVGIPGAAGVRQVGHFQPASPIAKRPDFAATTQPGEVLDPERILVTSTSNFGAPLGIPSQPTGAILSIDPSGDAPLLIPPDFAAADGQAAGLNGAVRLFTAQSPAFLNRLNNPQAVSALQPAVSNPRYISINNAFGRPWFANVPAGVDGVGTNTVIDPTGRPLANPPSAVAGGVFVGTETNRSDPWLAGDLSQGAVGTAFMGRSPDESGFAVFAVVKTDGSIVQVHVRDGVDGLAPPGTVTPLAPAFSETSGLAGAGLIGIAFNWVPQPILYLADGPANAVVALDLDNDGHIFQVQEVVQHTAPELANPVDLTPAIPEIANPDFSSHTTIAAGSDLYIANRGDGTLVRMTQAGQMIAQARINLPGVGLIGAERLNGIAVSADAQRLWLTLSGSLAQYPDLDGVLLEVSAFDANGPLNTQQGYPIAAAAYDEALIEQGRTAFMTEFSPEQGLGPLFNQRACLACHNSPTPGGLGATESSTGLRVGRLDEASGQFDPLIGQGGPVAQQHSIEEFGIPTGQTPGVPTSANVTSLRAAPSLYGLAILDQIPDEVILAQAVDKGDGIHGRPNMVADHTGQLRVGRFGWKADVATLDEMIAVALADELGITSPLAPHAERLLQPQTETDTALTPDTNGSLITAIKAYLASLPFPPNRRSK